MTIQICINSEALAAIRRAVPDGKEYHDEAVPAPDFASMWLIPISEDVLDGLIRAQLEGETWSDIIIRLSQRQQ